MNVWSTRALQGRQTLPATARQTLSLALLLLSPLLLRAATDTLDWDVVSAGGGTSANATCQVSDTVGQTASGVSSAGPCVLENGFWPGINATVAILPLAPPFSARVRGIPWIIAMPAPTGCQAGDSLASTVTNASGANGQGMIVLTVPAVPSPRAAAVHIASSGTIQLQFDGIPGLSYAVQRASPAPAGPWITLAIVTADTYGRFFYDDPSPPPRAAFYRAISP